MQLPKFAYHLPEKLEDALEIMQVTEGEARYIAGGTDLLVQMKRGLAQPATLIGLTSVAGMSGITTSSDTYIGSMTRLREVERTHHIRHAFPSLVDAIGVLATPQIRSMATIGGNLCNASPCADCAPPLLVMEARLTVVGSRGRKEIASEDFFHGPGQTCMGKDEILVGIRVSEPPLNTGAAFEKTGRLAKDITIVSAAALVTMNGDVCQKCRIAVGSVAPVPLRLVEVEKLMEGERVCSELLDQAATLVKEVVSPISDLRSTSDYRRHMSGVLVGSAIQRAIARAEEA